MTAIAIYANERIYALMVGDVTLVASPVISATALQG